MRHGVAGRKLNRTTEHRLALRRNLVQSLIEHGRVRTTLPKAKEMRAFAEQLITIAIRGTLADRQRATALLCDRSIIPAENRADYDSMSDAKREKVLRSRSGRRYRASVTRPGVKFTAESVIHRLFNTVAPDMKRRNEAKGCTGGYTRMIKLADRRIGDGSWLAVVELVGESDEPRPKSKAKTERKRRARVKYAYYAGKGLQRRGASKRTTVKAVADEPEVTESAAAESDGGEQSES
jgi:large subunit ribosomal protein L17